MFADDTKTFCVIRTSKIIQHYNMIWTYFKNMIGQFDGTFNILKCKHMHLGPMHHFGPYYLNGTIIDIPDFYKDLGIILGHQLKFHPHTTKVTVRANRLPGNILIIYVD